MNKLYKSKFFKAFKVSLPLIVAVGVLFTLIIMISNRDKQIINLQSHIDNSTSASQDTNNNNNDDLQQQLDEQTSKYSDLKEAVIHEHAGQPGPAPSLDYSFCGNAPPLLNINDESRTLRDPSSPQSKYYACANSVQDVWIDDYVHAFK